MPWADWLVAQVSLLEARMALPVLENSIALEPVCLEATLGKRLPLALLRRFAAETNPL